MARTWRVTPIHLDTVHYPDWHPRAGESGPVYAYLLQDGARNVMVDTGIGPPHPLIDRLYEPERRDPVIELLRHGVEPGDIEAVVISHLHFDHVGGAWNFPGVPLYVQRAEWEAAQVPKYTIPDFLDFPGANFRLIDGDFELAPGVTLLATPGHTPGHQCVVVSGLTGTVVFEGVETRLGGTWVLAGQAIETVAEFNERVAADDIHPAMRRILDLEPSRVWFSHDYAFWMGD